MSDEIVQRLQADYATFASGDDRLFIDSLHPDFKYRSREELPGGGEYEGWEVVGRRLAELRELFADIRLEPNDFVVAGEYVVVTLNYSAVGRGGGVRISQDVVHVWRMRDGKWLELLVFSDRAAALEAVALRLAQK